MEAKKISLRDLPNGQYFLYPRGICKRWKKLTEVAEDIFTCRSFNLSGVPVLQDFKGSDQVTPTF